MTSIRCRLAEWLNDVGMTPEELSAASGLPLQRVAAYCSEEVDSVSLHEAGLILSALGGQLTDLFELVHEPDDGAATGDAAEEQQFTFGTDLEWDSVCARTPDGRHRWYKDVRVSDTVYQEFVCQACKKRISVVI